VKLSFVVYRNSLQGARGSGYSREFIAGAISGEEGGGRGKKGRGREGGGGGGGRESAFDLHPTRMFPRAWKIARMVYWANSIPAPLRYGRYE